MDPEDGRQPPPPPALDASRWMGHLRDDLRLAELDAIPGTHNSATATCGRNALWQHAVWPWARCQAASIEDQLRFGVRWLDLRLTAPSGHGRPIVVSHRFATSYTLSDALACAATFVTAVPSEVVILNVKCDWDSRASWTADDSACAWALVRQVCGRAGCPVVAGTDAVSTCARATLRQLRGKLLVVPRDWRLARDSPAVNDDLSPPPPPVVTTIECWNQGSQAAAKAHLLRSLSGDLAGEGVGGGEHDGEREGGDGSNASEDHPLICEREVNVVCGGGLLLPVHVAAGMNAWLEQQLRGRWRGPERGVRLGVLLCDFATPRLVECLIRHALRFGSRHPRRQWSPRSCGVSCGGPRSTATAAGQGELESENRQLQ